MKKSKSAGTILETFTNDNNVVNLQNDSFENCSLRNHENFSFPWSVIDFLHRCMHTLSHTICCKRSENKKVNNVHTQNDLISLDSFNVDFHEWYGHAKNENENNVAIKEKKDGRNQNVF